MDRIGDKIREQRKALGHTQEQVARTVGRHRQWLGKVEKHERIPTPEELRKIAEFLDIESEELLVSKQDQTSRRRLNMLGEAIQLACSSYRAHDLVAQEFGVALLEETYNALQSFSHGLSENIGQKAFLETIQQRVFSGRTPGTRVAAFCGIKEWKHPATTAYFDANFRFAEELSREDRTARLPLACPLRRIFVKWVDDGLQGADEVIAQHKAHEQIGVEALILPEETIRNSMYNFLLGPLRDGFGFIVVESEIQHTAVVHNGLLDGTRFMEAHNLLLVAILRKWFAELAMMANKA